MIIKYKPSEFPSTRGVRTPFVGTLDNSKYERMAAYLIDTARNNGYWGRVYSFPLEFSGNLNNVLRGMTDEGFLVENEYGFMLTPKALDRIAAKYHV